MLALLRAYVSDLAVGRRPAIHVKSSKWISCTADRIFLSTDHEDSLNAISFFKFAEHQCMDEICKYGLTSHFQSSESTPKSLPGQSATIIPSATLCDGTYWLNFCNKCLVISGLVMCCVLAMPPPPPPPTLARTHICLCKRGV